MKEMRATVPKDVTLAQPGTDKYHTASFFSCCASFPVNQNQRMLIFCTTHKNMLAVMYSTDDSNQPRGAGPGNPTSSHVLQLQSPSIKFFQLTTRDSILNAFLTLC